MALSLVALGAGLAEEVGKRAAAAPAEEFPALATPLAPLALTDAQRRQVEQLEESESIRVMHLRDELAQASTDLRAAELAQPFDEDRVGALLWRQAEAAAYLRGTESRLIAEIVPLLTEPQRQALVALRSRSTPERSLAATTATCSQAVL